MKLPKILILDNYDSFTYNLLRCLEEAAPCTVTVCSRDAVTAAAAEAFDKIVLSPGAGVPAEAPVMAGVLEQLGGSKSILGVCLGHQAIAEFYGAQLINYPRPFHGLQVAVRVTDAAEPLFRGVGEHFTAGLYHSWGVNPVTLPACLKVTAVSQGGVIMALRHTTADVCGVQFHPESYMTPRGIQMLRNWITA